MPSLVSGMNSLLLTSKEIETDAQSTNTKVVKLRFTRKQYNTFRDACKILELVSAYEGFAECVSKALDADIKTQTITRQFVNPIIEAPTKIPMKIPRAQSDGPKRETYFTAPIDVTNKCKKLHSKIKKDVNLRHNIADGKTCVTDVRVMVSKYFSTHNLKTDDGAMLDDFILNLVPESIKNNKDILQRINGKYVIPKGDKKVMSGILNEVAFGSF